MKFDVPLLIFVSCLAVGFGCSTPNSSESEEAKRASSSPSDREEKTNPDEKKSDAASPTQSVDGPSSQPEAAKSGDESEDLSEKKVRRTVRRFETLLEKRRTGEKLTDLEWKQIFGKEPKVQWAGSPEKSAFNAVTTSRNEIRSLVDKNNHDGFCVPELQKCVRGCCRFVQSMSDVCAHHGAPVTLMCFESTAADPTVETVWTACPFAYDVQVEVTKGANCLINLTTNRPGTDYTCPDHGPVYVFFKSTCDGAVEFSAKSISAAGDAHYGYDLGSCTQTSCSERLTGTIGETEVEISLDMRMRSAVYERDEYYQFYPEKRPESDSEHSLEPSGE